MRRCFELARKGLGMTRTNPLVGCVIVHEDRIIGEGYHHEFGGPHAEVNAIRSVKDPSLVPRINPLLQPGTLCSSWENPALFLTDSAKGISQGCDFQYGSLSQCKWKGNQATGGFRNRGGYGCLEEEGKHLNRRFLHYVNYRRPYVILKWAQTADGFIDLEREPGDQEGPRWISDEVSRTLVHKWRSEESAIMVGTNTVLNDNPQPECPEVDG